MGPIAYVRDLAGATSRGWNAFFFTPAINGKSGSSLGNLFSTHPTIEKRLAQLDELERQLNAG